MIAVFRSGILPLLFAALAAVATAPARAARPTPAAKSFAIYTDLANRLGARPLPTRQALSYGDPDLVDPTVRFLALPSLGETTRLSFSDLPDLPDLTVMPVRATPAIVVSDTNYPDTHPATPFDNLRDGVVYTTATIPANGSPTAQRVIVYASAASQRGLDADLYVGIDLNGNGIPEADELLCSGKAFWQGDECFFSLPPSTSTRTLWILGQNVPLLSVPQQDRVIAMLLLPSLDGPFDDRLVVTGPGKAAAHTPVSFDIATHLPAVQNFASFGGLIAVKARREDAEPTVLIPLWPMPFYAAATDQILGNRAVDGHIVDQTVTLLAPGEADERIAIDVPANATALRVTTRGSGEIDLYVGKGDDEALRGPALGSAPSRSSAPGSSIHPGASERVDLTGATLTPGRWYLMPVNVGTDATQVTVEVDLTVAATPAPAVRAAGYYNPARSGHGLFLSDGATDRVLIWYTYDATGQPTWYYAQSPRPTSTEAVWGADLYRYSWNGFRSNGVRVGRVLTTASAANRFQFTALVDGRYVSEPMVELASQECPTVDGVAVDYSGSWYPPASPGTGASVLTLGRTEVEIAYLYDRDGNPRWLYGQVSPFGIPSIPLSQFSGFCPSCAYRAPTSTVVGALNRSFDNPRSGHAVVDAILVPPLAGNWFSNQDIEKLTVDTSCR